MLKFILAVLLLAGQALDGLKTDFYNLGNVASFNSILTPQNTVLETPSFWSSWVDEAREYTPGVGWKVRKKFNDFNDARITDSGILWNDFALVFSPELGLINLEEEINKEVPEAFYVKIMDVTNSGIAVVTYVTDFEQQGYFDQPVMEIALFDLRSRQFSKIEHPNFDRLGDKTFNFAGISDDGKVLLRSDKNSSHLLLFQGNHFIREIAFETDEEGVAFVGGYIFSPSGTIFTLIDENNVTKLAYFDEEMQLQRIDTPEALTHKSSKYGYDFIVNRNDQIVVTLFEYDEEGDAETHAFFWSKESGGALIESIANSTKAVESIIPYGMNAQGQIVGTFTELDGDKKLTKYFLLDKEQKFLDLTPKIKLDNVDWARQDCFPEIQINDNGAIFGSVVQENTGFLIVPKQ